ncbi:ATP-binding protein [Spiroplasma culicicola]|uniref:Histidine kinase/HSP90-like ATPase domain-containing protein n=1 Tax=Spiroplasma culicicola AES-1 TaxID=1276246 RepID=W6A7S6_9MOLU|nr:ATP-binding protein [Spiroplasma culicicola]AHI53041.1 hypothetical protein SCULI_v1c07000 [Spiroplasma culicicola AES-1]
MSTQQKVHIAGMVHSWTSDSYYLITTFGEFIDNSLSSAIKSGQKTLNMKIIVDGDTESYLFIDNGPGIESSKIEECWVMFNPEDDLNKDGFNRRHIGFKRGGFWLGKRVELFSKSKNTVVGTYLDYDEMVSKQNAGFSVEEAVKPEDISEKDINLYQKVLIGETGTIIGIKKTNFTDANNFNHKTVEFTSIPKDYNLRKNNIYVYLYFKYLYFIEGKADVKLNLSVVYNNQKVNINKESLYLFDYEITSEIASKQFKNFNFDKLEKELIEQGAINSNKDKQLQSDYGISVGKIINDIKQNKFNWEFFFPYIARYHVNNHVKLKAYFSFLNYNDIRKYSLQDIFGGVSIVQDNRIINMGNYTKMAPNLKVFERKILTLTNTSSGDIKTEDKLWKADIHLDTTEPNLKIDFQPKDDKSAIANGNVVENVLKEFVNFLKSDLHMDYIGRVIIGFLKGSLEYAIDENYVSDYEISKTKNILKKTNIYLNNEDTLKVITDIKKGELKLTPSSKFGNNKKTFPYKNNDKIIYYYFSFDKNQERSIEFKYSTDKVLLENILELRFNFNYKSLTKLQKSDDHQIRLALIFSTIIAKKFSKLLEECEYQSDAEQKLSIFIDDLEIFNEVFDE